MFSLPARTLSFSSLIQSVCLRLDALHGLCVGLDVNVLCVCWWYSPCVVISVCMCVCLLVFICWWRRRETIASIFNFWTSISFSFRYANFDRWLILNGVRPATTNYIFNYLCMHVCVSIFNLIASKIFSILRFLIDHSFTFTRKEN